MPLKNQLERLLDEDSENRFMTIQDALLEVLRRIEKLEDVLTELQVFLNSEGTLPSVHYFNEGSED